MSIEAGNDSVVAKPAAGAFSTNTQTETYKDMGNFDSIKTAMTSQSKTDLVDLQISSQLDDTKDATKNATKSDTIDFTPKGADATTGDATAGDAQAKNKDHYPTGVNGEERAERQKMPRDAGGKSEPDAVDRATDPNAGTLDKSATTPEAADLPPGSTRAVLNGRNEVTEFLYKDKSGNVHRLPYDAFKEMKPGTSRDFPPGFRVERETMRDLPGGFWVKTPDGQRIQLNPVGRLIDGGS